MLQCIAVRCSVLQCIAVRCSVLQCVTVCCSVLQCVALDIGTSSIPTASQHLTNTHTHTHIHTHTHTYTSTFTYIPVLFHPQVRTSPPASTMTVCPNPHATPRTWLSAVTRMCRLSEHLHSHVCVGCQNICNHTYVYAVSPSVQVCVRCHKNFALVYMCRVSEILVCSGAWCGV